MIGMDLNTKETENQRVRAAKELGMTLVPIKIDDDLQDEKSKLRALISNNFGRRKNNPVKDRKAIATYVELNGYKHGEIGNGRKKTCQNGTSTLDEIAKELNIPKRSLQRALRIERNLTDSMKELLDTGEITKTFTSDTIASLSEEEQEFQSKGVQKFLYPQQEGVYKNDTPINHQEVFCISHHKLPLALVKINITPSMKTKQI